MPYRLISRGTSRPTVNGQVRALRPNDVIVVNEDEKDRLMRGIYRNKFVVASYIPPVNESSSTKTKQPSQQKSEESLEPSVEEQPVEEQPEEEQPEEQPEEERKKEVTPIISQLEKEGLPNPRLDQGSHWATVRYHVQDLGEQVPIPFDLIKAIKIKFSHYKPVVEECEKLLDLKED